MDGAKEKDRECLRWIASEAAMRRGPPPLGLFDKEVVGVVDMCSVLARSLVRLEDEEVPSRERHIDHPPLTDAQAERLRELMTARAEHPETGEREVCYWCGHVEDEFDHGPCREALAAEPLQDGGERELYRVIVEGGGSFLYDRIDTGRLLVKMGEAGDDRAVSIVSAEHPHQDVRAEKPMTDQEPWWTRWVAAGVVLIAVPLTIVQWMVERVTRGKR